eukprot:4590467-Pyramimonas_sp.AAC.1
MSSPVFLQTETANAASLFEDEADGPWVDHSVDDRLDATRQAVVWVHVESEIERARLREQT